MADIVNEHEITQPCFKNVSVPVVIMESILACIFRFEEFIFRCYVISFVSRYCKCYIWIGKWSDRIKFAYIKIKFSGIFIRDKRI